MNGEPPRAPIASFLIPEDMADDVEALLDDYAADPYTRSRFQLDQRHVVLSTDFGEDVDDYDPHELEEAFTYLLARLLPRYRCPVCGHQSRTVTEDLIHADLDGQQCDRRRPLPPGGFR